MTLSTCWKTIYAVLLLYVGTATASPAQTFAVLADFFNYWPAYPYYGVLSQGTDGNFYGASSQGGTYGQLFGVSPSGTLGQIYGFCFAANCADGGYPYGGLVLGADGNLYGTTSAGGAHGWGTIFKVTTTGALTTLYSFCSAPDCADGASPYAGLVLGTDGNFYGTTAGDGTNNHGTVFRITPSGAFKALYQFCVSSVPWCTDGSVPAGGVVQGMDGDFYGTTRNGGSEAYFCFNGVDFGCGTVFKITRSGALTTLYNFSGADGQYPYAGLVQGTDGNLYGTTSSGAGNSFAGTVFKISSAGTLTSLHTFCGSVNCPDGSQPHAGLVQGTDGNFYGSTEYGGAGNSGTLFSITSSGALTTLYSFCASGSCVDGYDPLAGLIQGTDGGFYGTTAFGGSGGGTVFSLSMGLGPFVKTLPTSGPGRRNLWAKASVRDCCRRGTPGAFCGWNQQGRMPRSSLAVSAARRVKMSVM